MSDRVELDRSAVSLLSWLEHGADNDLEDNTQSNIELDHEQALVLMEERMRTMV